MRLAERARNRDASREADPLGPPDLVVKTVPTYTSTKAGIASIMSFDTFPTALDASQLRSAANVMLQYGFLHSKLDVAPMLLAGPES